MPVVAVINQKGGVGKTSIATNLASALAQNQHTVLLDSDPQRSAAGWATLNPRPDLLLTVQSVDDGMLGREARACDEHYDWTIIDCPPGINRVNVDAIRAADVVLIPCKPRVWDVWACADIVEGVKLRQQSNRGWPKAAFVISMVRPRTRFSQSIGDALQELGLPLLRARITEREAYAQAASEGRSVLTGKDRVARQEILDLQQEIKEMCNGLRQKTGVNR